MNRAEHNHLGNCCAPPDDQSEVCDDHGSWRGECTRCPPCAACDLEWDDEVEAAQAAAYRKELEEAGQERLFGEEDLGS